MKLFIYIIVLLSSVCHAQTRSIVPNQPGQGSIGRTNKMWASGYFEDVFVNGTNIESRISTNNVFTFNALTGSVELVAGDGVQIVTNGNQLTVKLVESPTTAIGTNRVYFQYTGYTNYWTVPVGYTQIAAWAWGGAGASGSGAGGSGGFSYGVMSVTGNQYVSIVVGQGGQLGPTSSVIGISSVAFPNGGIGVGYGSGLGPGGGGSSQIYFNTNLLVVAGGGGAGPGGGSGGGLSGGSSSTVGGGTQTQGGLTQPVTAQSMFWTNTSGSFMRGGDGGVRTNSFENNRFGAGGGGGYYGGAGSFLTPGLSSAGGAGSGYLNLNFILSGVTIRGIRGTPPSSEIPEYISGVGVSPSVGFGLWTNGNNGLIVIGY